MRYIPKNGDGGYRLNTANEIPPATKEQAQSRWKNFKHKLSVAKLLNIEQYGLCAYSELRCDLYALETHIEHIEPKSQVPQRTFDYQNLVLSALSSDDLHSMDRNDVFAGHAKLSGYDAELFISCLQVDCASSFVYLTNGQVEPNNKLTEQERNKTQYTIDLLNLNSPYLVTQRENWIDELDQLIDEHLENDMSLPDLAAIDLIPTSNKLSQFFTATRQRFGNIAEHVLAAHAPELL